MNLLRGQIFIAIQALIEEKNGIAFQRLAYQCLSLKWPSLMATAEQGDMGEDAKTVYLTGEHGTVRSLACSLTNQRHKLVSDAEKIKAKRSDVSELIFATPKSVDETVQEDWVETIKQDFGWRLIVVEYSEFVAILERPEAKWIREQHLGIHDDAVTNLKPEEDPELVNNAAGQLWDRGVNDQARSLYLHAHNLALAQRKPKAVCHALLGLAWCSLNERKPAEAYGLATGCLAIAQEAESLHYRASANMVRGRVALIQRNLDEAESCALSAVEDGKAGQTHVENDAVLLLVEIALAKGDAEEALHRLNSVYRRELKVGGRRAIAVYDLRASIHIASEKPRLAAETFEKAAQEAQSLGNLALHASYLGKAQRVLADAGAYRAALNRADACERAAEAIDNTPLLLEALFSKSWAQRHLNMQSDSKRTLERIASVAEEKSYHELAARAFVAYGQSLRTEGDLSESRAAVEKGLAFAKASGRDFLIGFALVELAEHDSLVGEFQAAQKSINDAREHFGEIPLPADYKWEIGQAELHIHDGLGNYDECLEVLDRMIINAKETGDRLPEAAEWAEKKKEEIERKKGALESVSQILRVTGEEAKKFAGTDKAQSLLEANQWVIGTLLDWWDGTRNMFTPPTDVLNLWGEANYGRIILNHRAYSDAFYLCVTISSVEQARTACRMLAPISDCLTLVWTGEVLTGIPFPGFPRHLAYDEPTIGWTPRPAGFWEEGARGYPICMPPFPRCLLPEDIVLFFLDEARALTERGKLFLVPGPGVGIVGQTHALSAQLFYQAACAKAVLKVDESIQVSPDLDMVLPWFPNIPISDLASLCGDHEDSLSEFRSKCMEWGDAIREGGDRKVSRVHADIASLSKKLDRLFRRAQGGADPDGQMNIGSATALSGRQDSRVLPSGARHMDITGRLRGIVGEELDENPWFPYWSFRQSGANWQLGSALTGESISGGNPIFSSDLAIRSGMAFHWLRVPGEHKMYVMLVKEGAEPDLKDAVIMEAKEYYRQNQK
jgi:tetratricopeptide (TPR) repeat protein